MARYEIANGVGYRPDDDQRGYRPPVKPEPFSAPPVRAPAATTEGTVTQRAHQTMVHAEGAYRHHVETTVADRGKYSAAGFREQLAAFADTAAARSVDEALADVQGRRDAAEAKLNRVRAGLTPDGDVAGELRATRTWQRTKGVLDNASEKSSVARKLIIGAGREQLGTLLQELPSYFEAHGLPTGWIHHEAARAVPEYAEARAELERADRAVEIANYNAETLKRSFTDEHSKTVLAAPQDKNDPDSA